MKFTSYSTNTKIVSLLLLGITLAITPKLNEDATTIPKLVVLIFLVGNLIPLLALNLKTFFTNKASKKVLLFTVLILVQLFLVLLLSTSPFEQKLFGRPFRLLGFLTFFFVVMLFLISYMIFEIDNYDYLIKVLALSGFISSLYTIIQSFGYDFVKWGNTSTLATGPMGLTNFQSAFAAIAVIPTIYTINSKYRSVSLIILSLVFYLITIYVTASIQGYLGMLIGLAVLLLLFLLVNYKKFKTFLFLVYSAIFGTLFAGMLGHGYFAKYLYKDSVQSRGDFWRSAIRISNENPIFGVGFDSFPDHYFRHKDQITANRSWYENSDSAHNYLLDLSAQIGYPGALLYLGLIIWVLYSFFRDYNRDKIFDFKIVSLFCAWLVTQATALINPINISLFAWNMVLSGALLKVTKLEGKNESSKTFTNMLIAKSPLSPIRVISSVICLLIVLPVFISDKTYFQAKKDLNFTKMIKVADQYPKSSMRFQDLSRELLLNKEYTLALEVSRNATKFNPNHVAGWALILINPIATVEERTNAKMEVLRLDPLNKQFKNFEIKVYK